MTVNTEERAVFDATVFSHQTETARTRDFTKWPQRDRGRLRRPPLHLQRRGKWREEEGGKHERNMEMSVVKMYSTSVRKLFDVSVTGCSKGTDAHTTVLVHKIYITVSSTDGNSI